MRERWLVIALALLDWESEEGRSNYPAEFFGLVIGYAPCTSEEIRTLGVFFQMGKTLLPLVSSRGAGPIRQALKPQPTFWTYFLLPSLRMDPTTK